MKEFDRAILAERIKSLRKEKNLGQNALADALKISNASVSYWETGKQEPCASAIFKLAEYFGVSADYILGLTDY
jgi:transcriptional regulator with XRE-family HTH domain